VSPDSPVTYREFKNLAERVDVIASKLDADKADVKDVDALHEIVRILATEVRGLRRILVGFMVAITLAAVGYAASTWRLANATQNQTQQERER
jgi:hypothetical protein